MIGFRPWVIGIPLILISLLALGSTPAHAAEYADYADHGFTGSCAATIVQSDGAGSFEVHPTANDLMFDYLFVVCNLEPHTVATNYSIEIDLDYDQSVTTVWADRVQSGQLKNYDTSGCDITSPHWDSVLASVALNGPTFTACVNVYHSPSDPQATLSTASIRINVGSGFVNTDYQALTPCYNVTNVCLPSHSYAGAPGPVDNSGDNVGDDPLLGLLDPDADGSGCHMFQGCFWRYWFGAPAEPVDYDGLLLAWDTRLPFSVVAEAQEAWGVFDTWVSSWNYGACPAPPVFGAQLPGGNYFQVAFPDPCAENNIGSLWGYREPVRFLTMLLLFFGTLVAVVKTWFPTGVEPNADPYGAVDLHPEGTGYSNSGAPGSIGGARTRHFGGD